jgi:uncharacterized protein YlxP (DUF503 family)
MIVGVLRVSLLLRGSHSLKDKRRVVRSLKDRIRNRLNAAIAEVDSQDLHQRADLGIVTVSGDRVRAEAVLTDAITMIDRAPGAERFDTDVEYF